MAATDEKWVIEKLNGSNWMTWRFQMRHLLLAKDLWSFVDGTSTLAEDASATTVAEFNKKKQRALSTIVLALDSSVLYLVTNTKTPQEAWQVLQKHFDRGSLANKIYLKKKLFRMQMKEGTPVAAHLKQMKELTDHLAIIGAPISEEDQVVTLLGSLPPSYATLVTALETSGDLELDMVQSALFHEEQKQESKLDSASSGNRSDSALVGSHKMQKYKGKKPAKGPIVCYECGEEGHIRRDCPKNSMRRSKTKPWHKAKNAEVSNKSVDSSADAFSAINKSAYVSCKKDRWIVDSGASSHMTNLRNNLCNFVMFEKPELVALGDGKTVEAVGVGDVKVNMLLKSGKSRLFTFMKCLFVPNLASNLFSVRAAASKGKTVLFGQDLCQIFDKNGQLVGLGSLVAKLYELHCQVVSSDHEATVALKGSKEADLWHQRLGHLCENRLKMAIREKMVTGIRGLKQFDLSFCEGCVQGKMQRKPFKPVGEIRSTKKLELVHTDICGPMQTESFGGKRYFVTFIDDYSRFCKVYFMRQKTEVLDKFKEFEAYVQSVTGEKVRALRSDNGGEYVSQEFKAYLKAKGVHHQLTAPHCPQQNGVSERMNRTLVESARAMLNHAGLPKRYWAEAVSTAAYLNNLTPKATLRMRRTPFEFWFSWIPSIAHLKVFGCAAYALVPDETRQKLDKKAEKFRFVGYAEGSKSYRLMDANGKVFIRRDVIFNEEDFKVGKETVKDADTVTVDSDPEETGGADQTDAVPVLRCSERQRKAPVRYGFDEYAGSTDELQVVHVAYKACQIPEPRTIDEALSSGFSKEWKEAADLEYKAMLDNGTWELVELPDGRTPVGSKWVFRVKHKSDGTIERFKARIVAKGYSQKYGIDYDETFSPVVKFSSIRTLLAWAVQKGMYVHQMDVVTAFLNGPLDEEIYMVQPDGYIKPGEEHLVCKLKKSLYGLKQAPRCWNKALQEHLENIGFKQSDADPCVFVQNADKFAILAVYVDDLILITEDQQSMDKVKKSLSSQFKMKDMGKLHYCLGVSVVQDEKEHCLWLHQKQYILNLLEKYGMTNVKPVATPLDINVKLEKDDGVSKPVDAVKYQSMVGSLLYAAIATRPDIAHAVGVVSKFNSKPTEAHLTAVKRIFCYLRGTVDLALKYQNVDKKFNVVGYSDADWANDRDDRHSITGNVFKFANGAISWLSKKQAVVALSTAEAEYIALSSAAQEAIWLKRLLNDLGYKSEDGIQVLEDNQGAMALSKNPVGHARTKHIDIRHHFIREAVAEKVVTLQYCPSEDMVADILTKALPREKFEKHRLTLGMHCLA